MENEEEKILAMRVDKLVYLPKYVNAEMLMLEFFRGETLAINPVGNCLIDGESENYHGVVIHMHVDILDELIDYINRNI